MITTNRPGKYFTDAENEIFTWDSSSPDELTHKASKRSIYQMRWIDDKGFAADFVDDNVRSEAMKFWTELYDLRNPKMVIVEAEEPEHGKNGYCRKCHTYCWGDCQSH